MFKVGPIQIFVSDLEKAKEWYTQVLGMEFIEEYPEFKCILMRLGDVEFDIGVPNPTWGEDWKNFKIGVRIPVFLVVSDISKTIEELKRKGVRIVKPIRKMPWNEYNAIISDPFGNEFVIVQEIKRI